MFKPTIKTLINKCNKLRIKLDPEKEQNTLNKTPKTDKYSSWDLTRKISNHNLIQIYGSKDLIPKTLLYRNQLQSCMLSARMTEQKEDFKNFVLSDESPYIAEEKYNGLRISIFYTPAEGFKLYSNNRATDTLIPIENTQQVVWKTTGYNIPVSFILDCECICPVKSIDTTEFGGVITDSALNSALALTQMSPENSHRIQKTQNAELQFYIFDVPFYKRNLVNEPYYKRREVLEKLVPALQKFNLPFHLVPVHRTNKQYYFEQLVDTMHEGIMLKNINGIYTWNETRSRDIMLKMKRSLKMQSSEDIDVFIMDSLESSQDKKYANYIGGFKLGCILRGFQGDIIHHVASISSLPDDLRIQATTYVDGKPTLNPEFKFKVLTVDAFDVKQTSLRFSHARVSPDWKSCWRPDKSYNQCIIMEDFLLNQSL